MTSKKTWWQSWISILVGLGTICTCILGFLSWQYNTFATTEKVNIVKEHAQQIVAQLSQKTLEGFKSVNKTNIQMQKSIRRFDLKDTRKKSMQEKYNLLKKIENEPNNQELKIDLDVCRSRIKLIEEELKALRIGK